MFKNLTTLLLEQSNRKFKFVVHAHYAKKAGLHFDLRIEKSNGKLDSWAIRKGIPMKPGVKHLAIKQPVHDRKWLTIKGNYKGDPGSEYGAGRLEIWDTGTCYRLTDKLNDVVFLIVSAKKMKGKYVLHRMRNNDWILFKVK